MINLTLIHFSKNPYTLFLYHLHFSFVKRVTHGNYFSERYKEKYLAILASQLKELT